MEKETIKTVDEWIAEFIADLESEVDEVGEVLTWYQVAVFVNDRFEYSIFQGYVDEDGYSVAEGYLDSEWIEDDYEERLANKPARIARELEWYPRPNSFSEHEYTGDIYLELV